MKMILLSTTALMIAIALTGCKTISRIMDGSGTVYVVEIETNGPNRPELLERIMMIIEFRMNAVGIDGEASRSADAGNRIEVKIYGSHDPEFLRRFLFTTHRLELKKVVSPPSPSPLRTFPTREEAAVIATTGQQVLPFKERYVDESAPARFVIIEKEPVVTGEDIRNAYADSRTGSDLDYQIAFTLKKDGAEKLGEWTGRNINNYLAVVLDDNIQSVAYIKSQIFDRGEVTGHFTKADAEELAMSLNSGYMPATMKVVEDRPFK